MDLMQQQLHAAFARDDEKAVRALISAGALLTSLVPTTEDDDEEFF